MAYGILVLWPGIKPAPPALVAQSLNHWTTREPCQMFIFLTAFSVSPLGYLIDSSNWAFSKLHG